MTMNRHHQIEELISSSLTGDLSDAERRQLDAHLDACARCRATLAAFAGQRRIVSGLRHVGAPADLGARVRTGIQSGALGGLPWWRRPAVLFAGLGGGLAAVAGALLAAVILNAPAEDRQVGDASESPSAAVSAMGSPASAEPSASPSPTSAASEPASPSPSAAPAEASPQPDLYLALTGPFDNLALTVRDGGSGYTVADLDTPSGPPIAAELSPNGQFLAYITELGQSGRNELRLTHVGAGSLPGLDEVVRVETPLAEWETVILGESAAGSPFLERLAWSPGGDYLAYTLADPNGGGAEVWIFDSARGEPRPLTDMGAAYAGSWAPSIAGTSRLWVSVAGEQPASYLIDFHPEGGGDFPTIDPAEVASAELPGIFQPLTSPDGEHAIYWRGVMQRSGDEWLFAQGGAPYIGDIATTDTAQFELIEERPLFSDVLIDRDAFTTAGITWGADSDAYAVWGAQWSGIPQGSDGEYPNVNRVYFGHASDARDLTEFHAIDEGDVPEGASVVDVKVPTERHLVITARHPVGGVMEAPRADLILVTRNTGNVADEIELLPDPDADGWFGPAAYDAYWELVVP